MKALKALQRKHVAYSQFAQDVAWYVIEGLSLGALQRELTERMWRNTFETRADPARWARAREAGLDIPAEQTLVPLADMEVEVLSLLATFVQAHWPNGITALRLEGYLGGSAR